MTEGQSKVAQIIMRRDGMSAKDAEELVLDTIAEIEEAAIYTEDVEDILASNLGLEPDYLFDLMM